MPEIQVIFPPKDMPGLNNVKVHSPTVVTNQRERITWNIYNCDDRIQYVEIEIQHAGGKIFFTPSSPLVHGRAINGKSDIYTDIPDLNESRPVLLKYIVRGWNSNSKTSLIRELDPEILVNEP